MEYSDQFCNTCDFAQDKQWKLPFGLAIAVHILTFILLIVPPSFLLPDRDIPDIQTINLFTAEELLQAQKPQPAPPAEPKVVPEPVRKETPPPQELVSTAVEPAPAAPVPGEVLSLNPRKMKKKILPKPQEPDLRMKALERIQARVNQQREEEQIKHELARLRDTLHTQPPQDQPQKASASAPTATTAAPAAGQSAAGGPASSGTVALFDLAMKKYLIAINRRISDNWALPDTQDWDKNLEAVVVIVVRNTGIVSKTYFEKKSKNIYFDQYVEKTIQASLPMPPFPSDLKKNTLEIGLRFRPSGLF